MHSYIASYKYSQNSLSDDDDDDRYNLNDGSDSELITMATKNI